jgi:hypothetical protein
VWGKDFFQKIRVVGSREAFLGHALFARMLPQQTQRQTTQTRQVLTGNTPLLPIRILVT